MSLTNNTTQEMSYLTIGSNTYEIVDANAARLNSPAFTGTPTAPTPTTNSGIATKEYVDNAVGSSGGGTITEVKTNAGTHTTIDVTQGIAEFNVPTTYSHVGAAASSHTHGNITNGGDITATAPTIANGDQLVINDNSASKITNGPTFDGSTTTKALTPKGTWETFATSDTNTTYALSNALSSHKFTETLTAGGSGSGTSTATMEFVAGTGITLTDDTTNKKITIANSVTNTDEKVKLTSKSDNVAYKIALAPSSITSGNTYDEYYSTNLTYNPSTKALVTNGTVNGYTLAAASAKAVDTSISSASTSVNLPTSAAVASFVEGKGYITSYTDENMKWTASTTTNDYYPLQSTSTATTSTANTLNGVSFYQYYNTAGGYRRLILGNGTSYTSTGGAYGTIRLYGTGARYGDLMPGIIGANSLTDNRTWTLPDATGTIALTSDIPTVPTITLNGSTSTTPSFYAPTSAGTSGYYLKSNGSGAPSWTSFPTIPSITLNGSTTTSPSFYAPTTAGTSGYYLKSNGSGAPTWVAAPSDVVFCTLSLTSGGSGTTSMTPSEINSEIGNGKYVVGYDGSNCYTLMYVSSTEAVFTMYYFSSTTSGIGNLNVVEVDIDSYGVLTWSDVSVGGGVSDVTVAGTSVVTNNVATIAAPVQIVRW